MNKFTVHKSFPKQKKDKLTWINWEKVGWSNEDKPSEANTSKIDGLVLETMGIFAALSTDVIFLKIIAVFIENFTMKQYQTIRSLQLIEIFNERYC